MDGLPMGTVTFLLTDVEESTRLWEEHPDGMRRSAVQHDAIIEFLAEQYQGRVVRPRGEGDSRFCVFTRATQAVAAAAAIQRALYAEAWPMPVRLRVRMALHTGEADLREGDYYGQAVNRCARLRAIAHGDQTLLSEVTTGLVRDALPTGVALRELGEQRLRDLTRPERIYQLLVPGLPDEFPPVRSLDALPNNLPVQVTSFVGREAELAEIQRLLKTTRLLTLTGVGGCGKTRLALQAAADLLDEYEDGVWVADLAPLADPALVPQAVAAALGVREVAGQPLTTTLLHFARPRRFLLVLDTCEHIVDACARLTDALIRAAPHVGVLATSREVLGIAGEVRWRVPSLSAPPGQLGDDVPNPAAALGQYEAVKLFVDRAVAALPSFQVTDRNAPAVAQICHRLDGIPLAIELAAACAKVLSVEQIASRLDQRFRLLTGGSRTALPRQQTLAAAVAWSYDLLAEPEKLLFGRLAVFSGAFPLEAAERVCAADGILEEDVLDLLGHLVDKSLVLPEEDSGSGRYRLLETLRQYGREQLRARGLLEGMMDRHASYYVGLAEEAAPELVGREQLRWLDRIEREHDNVRAALLRLTSRPDAIGALRLAGALWRFWWAHGHRDEGRQRLAEVLAMPGASARDAARARALVGAAALFVGTYEGPRARPLLEESLEIFRELDDQPGVALALQLLARTIMAQGDTDTPQALLEENLEIGHRLGDRRIVAEALFARAVLVSQLGDLATARSLLMESLGLWREQGDRISVAYGLRSLGYTANSQGDVATTRALLEDSLGLFREVGDRWSMAQVLGDLGEVATAQGDYPAARRIYEQGLALWRQLGNRQGMANMQNGFGYVVAEEGDPTAARELFKAALATRRELGGPFLVTLSLAGFAYLAATQGQAERALRLAGAVSGLSEASGWKPVSTSLGRLERKLGSVRQMLSQDAADAAWAAGRAMTLEQAIAYASSDGQA